MRNSESGLEVKRRHWRYPSTRQRGIYTLKAYQWSHFLNLLQDWLGEVCKVRVNSPGRCWDGRIRSPILGFPAGVRFLFCVQRGELLTLHFGVNCCKWPLALRAGNEIYGNRQFATRLDGWVIWKPGILSSPTERALWHVADRRRQLCGLRDLQR